MNIVFWGEARQSGTTANLIATAGVLSELCPQKKVVIRRRMERVREKADYVFFDCGTGLTERNRRMLWRADAVVMNLRQDEMNADHFLGSHLHLAKQPFVLLGSYFGEVEAGRKYLERIHRISSEQTGAIPYNSAFHQAMLCGRGSAFVKREYREPANACNEQFIEETERIARYILRAEAESARKRVLRAAYQVKEQPSTFHKTRRK